MYNKIPRKSIKKIAVVLTDCKKSLQQVVAEQKCQYAINGGLYNMKTGKLCPIPLRVNGKTLANHTDGYWGFAWNEGKDFCMIHSYDMEKWDNFIACSAMLKDGKNTIFKYDAAQGGTRGRTGIGDDPDYIHLDVTTDKSSPCKPEQLRNRMKSKGAKDAIMMDCGGSSQGYLNGTYIQHEKRKVKWWICIWTEEQSAKPQTTSKNPYTKPTKTIYPNSPKTSIKWLQWELVNRAFLDNSDGKQIDGIMGTRTRTAVKNLQKALGFTGKDIDGVCGPMTISKMEATQ